MQYCTTNRMLAYQYVLLQSAELSVRSDLEVRRQCTVVGLGHQMSAELLIPIITNVLYQKNVRNIIRIKWRLV